MKDNYESEKDFNKGQRGPSNAPEPGIYKEKAYASHHPVDFKS